MADGGSFSRSWEGKLSSVEWRRCEAADAESWPVPTVIRASPHTRAAAPLLAAASYTGLTVHPSNLLRAHFRHSS
jgi:hypothetical protein